jgi:hypothetical protein
MALGSALGLVLLARNAGIAISHPAGFCMPSVEPYYIPSFCVAGVARNLTSTVNFCGSPGTISCRVLFKVQIAATKCEKGAVHCFIGCLQDCGGKVWRRCCAGVVQGTVQGGVEGAVQTALAMSGKSAVCKV